MKKFDLLIFRILEYAEKQEKQKKHGLYPLPEFEECISDQTQHHLKKCVHDNWLFGGQRNEIFEYLTIGKLTIEEHRILEELGGKGVKEITRNPVLDNIFGRSVYCNRSGV